MGLVEEDLPGKIRLLDHVAIDDHQLTDAAAVKGLGQESAEGAAAHDENAGLEELLLASLPEGSKPNLPIEPLLAHRRILTMSQATSARAMAPTARNGRTARKSPSTGWSISTQLKYLRVLPVIGASQWGQAGPS